MNVPFYTSVREYKKLKPQFLKAVQDVMESGDFILGKEVADFEEKAAQFTGVKYAVGVASGSDALVIGSDILGFKDGAEVLTPTFTFFASASCIARLGAKPVFVDMDPDTFNMDISEAERRMTKKTKGIIPVHLFLQCCDMEHITRLAKNNGLKVLEDAAESWGMRTSVGGHSRMAGTIGDIGIYSFFPTKTLGAYGDAGLMVTNDERLYQQIKSYRVHGTKIKYHHDYIGYNSRLDTIQAAILTVKIQYSHDSIKMRAKHAEHYTSLLKDVSGIRFPKIKNINEPVYYVYNLLVENRDKLAEHLKAKGIGYSVYYPIPLHLQKCFSYLGHQRGDFPVAEKTCDEIIALPMFPELKEEEVEYTAETIKAFYRKGK